MKQADRLALKEWQENHVLMTVTFYWREKGSDNEIRLKNRTYNEGLRVAKAAGYKEPKWYNPWTWWNGVVTVG